MKVYLDSAASTIVDSRVVEKMKPFFSESYANPSSIHEQGETARYAVENAREIIAKSINAGIDEIVFTSGGTESNNFAIKGVAFANKAKGNHIIISKTEHACTLNAARWLKTQGFEVTELNVDKDGFLDLEELEKAITGKTILVSIIHGNNEIGTINHLEPIGNLCRKKNIIFHTDACQSYTKTDIDVKRMGIDMLSINAHKIHGPKGVGALYLRRGIKLTPLFHGGGQERGLRSGTLNVSGIVGFGESVRISDKSDIEKMIILRDELVEKLLNIKGTKLNGPKENRLCNNINISFEGIDGEALLLHLSDDGIAVSTGSACSSELLEPSHVLKAIGVPKNMINGSIRLSISRYNTGAEIEYTVRKIKTIVNKLRISKK